MMMGQGAIPAYWTFWITFTSQLVTKAGFFLPTLKRPPNQALLGPVFLYAQTPPPGWHFERGGK
jgi:hypothetical protein